MEDLNRLKQRRDFTRVYQRGKSKPGKNLVLCYRKTGLPRYRVGFTVSKKVGNAVVRNKVRRRLREMCRLKGDMFPPGYDFVIIARPSGKYRTYNELYAELQRLIKGVFPE